MSVPHVIVRPVLIHILTGEIMTDPNYTHLTLVVDRSGSMSSFRDDAQGGIDTLLTEQFADTGIFTYTLVEFDGEINTVSRLSSTHEPYTLLPRGNTALFDAVGSEIIATGADLARLPEEKRPEKILFAIVTDGHENASREFNLSRLRDMIATQERDYSWNFQFIGAEAAAWQGQELGINSSSYRRSEKGASSAFKSMSRNLGEFRKSDKDALFFMEVDIEDEE